MTVVTPPPGAMLPNNTLLYSRHGDMNSKLAGGDVDGDLCQADWPACPCVPWCEGGYVVYS